MTPNKNSNFGKDLGKAAARGAAQGFLNGIMLVVGAAAILGLLLLYAAHH
jgi:threonine/homoserine/homoserine lactone efflux protein